MVGMDSMEDSGFDSDQKPVQANGTNSHVVSSLKHMSAKKKTFYFYYYTTLVQILVLVPN